MIAAVLLAAASASLFAQSYTPTYDHALDQLQNGSAVKAKGEFSDLLELKPTSNGALEGLTLSCLRLGEYENALGYARRYVTASSSSAYALGMEAHALHKLRREEEELAVNSALLAADPCAILTAQHDDDERRLLRDGAFPFADASKSIGPESLNTPAPQRIVYEGRDIGTRARKSLTSTLDLVGETSLTESAQRNETGQFTYFDILDQMDSIGLEGRPTKNLAWQTEYGESFFSDVSGSGVGRTQFSRVKFAGQWHVDPADYGAYATRQPKFLRGAGGSRYFAILREDDLGASAEGPLVGMDWLGKASVSDFSEGSTYHDWSLTGTKEYGREIIQPVYSHSEQEFYGATPGGRLGYVVTDRLGARWKRTVEAKYSLAASGGETFYVDGNRLVEATFDGRLTIPWEHDYCGERPLSVGYSFLSQEFRRPTDTYLSTDNHSHTLGVYWREGWRKLWTTLGYEHSFTVDSRGSYTGNAGILELEAYKRDNLSIQTTGRIYTSTVRDESYSFKLTARYSF